MTEHDDILPLVSSKSLNKLPRAKVKKFIYKISLGENKYNAFISTFPGSEKWNPRTIYRHINALLLKDSSKYILKEYRDKMIEMFDQKKIELIHYLESEVYENPNRTFNEKLHAIEMLLKLMESFKNKNEQVIQNININAENTKAHKINEIFGIPEQEAEVIEINE